jgi:hypothetical protein
LICDLIRFCFASTKLKQNIKARFILELLQALPNRDASMGLLEVCICLCIDLFTFQRTVNDLSVIRMFFSIFREYPGLTYFIDKVCARHPKIPLAVAEAMAACGEVINITSVSLPTVEIEPQGMDLQGALNHAVQKLKWQKNSLTVMAECSGNVLRAILADGLPPFDVPPTRNDGVKMMIRAKNAALCSAVCTKNQSILRLTIFELVSTGEVEFLKSLLHLLFESEVAADVLPALSNSLILRPEVIESMPAVLDNIPETVDPSPFIRFMAHDCTMDEISLLTNTPIFPSVPSQMASLFKDSLKWKSIVQASFWNIVRNAYSCDRYAGLIVTTLQLLIKPLSEGSISSFNMKQLLKRTSPSPVLAPLVLDMVDGSETQRLLLVTILVSWCHFFQTATATFVQDRKESFRTLYNSIPSTAKLLFPALVVNLITDPI